jgi:putative MATE family efflux protein
MFSKAKQTKPDTSGYFFSNQDLKKLIVPLILEQILSITVGMADSVMVSSAGESAVSAVSLADSIFILLINLFAALGTGGAVICGQHLGRRDPETSCRAAGQLVLFTAVFSTVIMALTYLCKPFILHVVFGQITEEVMSNCNTYLLIVTASIPFIALYNAGAAIFRSMGDSKTSMYMSLIMNGINLTGNAILIFGLHMGIAGAAIPTLVSRMVSAVVILKMLTNQRYTVHLPQPFSFRFDGSLLKKILGIGIPNGLENSMFQLGKILVLSIVSGFGTASIAANAVSNNLAMFQNLSGTATGYALLTVVSRCVGARDYKQARYYTKKIMAITYVTVLISTVLILILLPSLISLYHLSPEASAYTKKILWAHGIGACTIWPLAFPLPNVLRAASDVKYTMFFSILSMWIFRIGFSSLLGVHFGWGVFGVWIAMEIDWVFRAICFVARYASGKWQKIR